MLTAGKIKSVREKLSCLLFLLKGSVVSVSHLKSSKPGS